MVDIDRRRNSSKMAVFSQLCTTTSPLSASISATRASPRSRRSMASVTTASASVSPGPSSRATRPQLLDLGLEDRPCVRGYRSPPRSPGTAAGPRPEPGVRRRRQPRRPRARCGRRVGRRRSGRSPAPSRAVELARAHERAGRLGEGRRPAPRRRRGPRSHPGPRPTAGPGPTGRSPRRADGRRAPRRLQHLGQALEAAEVALALDARRGRRRPGPPRRPPAPAPGPSTRRAGGPRRGNRTISGSPA